MFQNYLPEDTVNQCIKIIYNKDTVNQNVKIIYNKDTVNQCVKFIYQKTLSTNVSNLPIKRHSQPMCSNYLPKDTVNQCV
jgi:hypothetical protein